jgi:hypothetical protein
MMKRTLAGRVLWLMLLNLAWPQVVYACSMIIMPDETMDELHARIYGPVVAQSQFLWLLGVVAVLVLLWRKRQAGQPLGWYNLALLAALFFHPAFTVQPSLGGDCSISTFNASIGVSVALAIIIGLQFPALAKTKVAQT